MLSFRSISTAAAVLFGTAVATGQTAVTPGNVVVFQAGAVANNTTISLLEINTTATLQTVPVQTIPVSTGTGSIGLYTSGSATSTGYLKTSADGTFTFTGHVGNNGGVGNANTILARGVGVLSQAGVLTAGPTYTGVSGNQTRSAITSNGTDFYIGDQGGIYLNGGTSPALAANVRSLQIVGAQSYVGQASTTAIATSALTPALPVPSGVVTASPLPGMPAIGTFQDQILLASAGGAADTIYIATQSGINKYSFDGTAWTARGTATVTGGFFGITGVANGTGGVDLFLTTGGGAVSGNRVVKYTDSSLFDANIALGAESTLFTTATGTTIKGIALAPVPEPATLFGLSVGVLGLARCLRRNARPAA